jgi:acyl-CoA synthetase (AMP-forming)/AMP-acid ligase II
MQRDTMLLGDLVARNARHKARAEALIVGERTITYGELQDLIEAAARGLAARGVGKGDRVAALGRNSIEYVQLYFATARLGALLVPLSFWQRPPEIDYAVEDSEPSLLFVEPEMRDLVSLALEARGDSLPVVELPSREGDDSGWRAFVEQGAQVGEAALAVELAPEDPHMILYTSGTTGRPKGAILSHGRTVDDAFAMALALRLRGDDTFVDYFPSFHVANWDHLKLYLLVGARTVLLREFDADVALDVIERHGATVLLGVPTMFHDILEHPRFAATDTSSVRLVYYGAYDPSGIMARTAEAFGAAGGQTEMAHTYGLTEAGPFVAYCPPEEVFRHWGSIGRPLPGVDVALLDDDLAEVPLGTPGEICVRGPLMSGYWRKQAETEAAFAGGWLHTGDMAVRDEEGYLRIVDRKKDMIRSGGQNIYSKQIEDCLSEHPAVDDCAIIGLPDAVYEELVCAVVVVRAPAVAGEELAAALKRHVRAQLAGYNAPREVRFVDALPKNAVGKTQKQRLRAQFGSTFAGGATAAAPGEA